MPNPKDQIWRVNGLYHRVGGPAIIRANGDQSWYQHGYLHREGGPARIEPNGDQSWYQMDIYIALMVQRIYNLMVTKSH
jgi:hypothetical protein